MRPSPTPRPTPLAAQLVRITLVALIFLAGCQRPAQQTSAPNTLEVFAASSLREAFQDAAERFQKDHPDAKIQLHFAGSQALKTQLQNGAHADIFASASPAHIDALSADGLTQDPHIFAHNKLVIVLPADNPAQIDSVEDLSRAERLVVGAKEVPIGAYTLEFLARAEDLLSPGFRRAVEARIISREANVRLVLSKIELGEADAGVVYKSDARAHQGRLKVVEIPDDLNIKAAYMVAQINAPGAPEEPRDLARAWVQFIQSPTGQNILKARGFSP